MREAVFQPLARSESESASCVRCHSPVEGSRCDSCGSAARAGAYRILRVISEAAHGRMYVAEDAKGRRVALKEMTFSLIPDVTQLDAFHREAQLLSELNHPQIPKMLGSFTEGGGVRTRMY